MKAFLEFDDAGAQDNEQAKGVTVGDIRAWHDRYDGQMAEYFATRLSAEANARFHEEFCMVNRSLLSGAINFLRQIQGNSLFMENLAVTRRG